MVRSSSFDLFGSISYPLGVNDDEQTALNWSLYHGGQRATLWKWLGEMKRGGIGKAMARRSTLLEEEKRSNSDDDQDNQTSDGDHAGLPPYFQASWMTSFSEWITVGSFGNHTKHG